MKYIQGVHVQGGSIFFFRIIIIFFFQEDFLLLQISTIKIPCKKVNGNESIIKIIFSL